MAHELEYKSKYVLVTEHVRGKIPVRIEPGMTVSSVDSQHKKGKAIRVLGGKSPVKIQPELAEREVSV